MTAHEDLKILAQKWQILLATAAFGLIVGFSAYSLIDPTYSASATLYISSQTRADDASQAYQGAQLSEQRITSYIELATSRRIADEVLSVAKLNMSPSEVQDSLEATSENNTVLLTITATTDDPQQTVMLADVGASSVAALISELERPSDLASPPVTSARIVEPAVLPTSPTFPNLEIFLVCGLILGIAGGIAGIILVRRLDRSIRTSGDLASTCKTADIGSVSEFSGTTPLFVLDDQFSPASEQVRRIRTSLLYLDIDKAPKTIALTSALPGEGKTTTASNLAIALAQSGSRTLLVDADLRRPNVAELFSVAAETGLTSVLARQVSPSAAVQGTRQPSLSILTSGPLPPNPSELLGSQRMRTVLQELTFLYDYIVLDTAPLLPVSDTNSLAALTDGVIFVCRYGGTNKARVNEASDLLRSGGALFLGAVLTITPKVNLSKYNTYYSQQENSRLSDHVARSSTVPPKYSNLVGQGNRRTNNRPSPVRRSTPPSRHS